MKHHRSIVFAGAAIIASSSPLLAGASAASAAAAPAVTITAGKCTVTAQVSEDHDSHGAFVDMLLKKNTCGVGVEGAITGPSGKPASYGGDIHQVGKHSVTGHIPINGGNHHGFRFFANNTWHYAWRD
jgi:hypothetical protein